MTCNAVHGRRAGFTLVESLLSIVVIAATVIAAGELMSIGLGSYSVVVDRREALQDVRLAINMMTGEIQQIVDPATDITEAQPTSVTFNSAGGGQVRYYVQGGRLFRQDATDTNTLADNVTANTGFEYYTAGGATTSNPSLVHRIHITVEANSAHGAILAKSNVYLRNRYYDAFTQQ